MTPKLLFKSIDEAFSHKMKLKAKMSQLCMQSGTKKILLNLFEEEISVR